MKKWLLLIATVAIGVPVVYYTTRGGVVPAKYSGVDCSSQGIYELSCELRKESCERQCNQQCADYGGCIQFGMETQGVGWYQCTSVICAGGYH